MVAESRQAGRQKVGLWLWQQRAEAGRQTDSRTLVMVAESREKGRDTESRTLVMVAESREAGRQTAGLWLADRK